MPQNFCFDDITLGQTAELERHLTQDDLYIFAHVSGNLNPLNLPPPADDGSQHTGAASAMWLGSLFSAVMGNILPGPGSVYEAQTLKFHRRAHVGERLMVKVTVTEKHPPNTVVLRTEVWRGRSLVVEGEARVRPPHTRIAIGPQALPALTVQTHRHAARLIAACHDLPPMITAVVAPEEASALLGALKAAAMGLIKPIFVGDRDEILNIATAHGITLDPALIEHAASQDEAAALAVTMVRAGKAAALMKGHLHTDVLLHHVVKSDGGLRGPRRLSHVFVMDVPTLGDLLLVSDAAINIAPTLEEKADIVQNAIFLAQALGLEKPKAGILAAVEVVNPKMPATIDAAALSKMAERGQIIGGIVDGPLAMDNAISLNAARTKGIFSPVAGRADILIVPNLEAGNILAKQLTYASRAQGAGIVLGAKVPVLLSSRADDEDARLFSCAVAVLYAHWQEHGVSAVKPWNNPENLV